MIVKVILLSVRSAATRALVRAAPMRSARSSATMPCAGASRATRGTPSRAADASPHVSTARF